ncbi:hypothetical protein L9F63_007221 [Diploptera punctata]|uniref:Nucleolar protein 11 n=1 Tax=Diploptera punctata TaxID=6984 RepID=A0AAD8E3Y8_DIPPU|nr:hypothetical protein L9F63_007221 [Diploptera punctata]
MARLGAYYSLCPLIDQKSLLGVAEDSATGCVIVTLGKNMVIRYKLMNQKQINSWSSKEKLSSPVIYDSIGNQYIAIFNKTQLRIWTENDENLDKVKKIKFQEQVHCILPPKNGNGALIVFNNGVVEPLSTALETRKTKNTKAILASDEEIEDCKVVVHQNYTYVTIFSRKSEEVHYHAVPIKEETLPLKLKIAREQVNLIGHATVEESCQLLTLWSDGKMFSLPFLQEPPPESPGTLVNVISIVSTKHPIAMASLSSSHVAIYGADSSEEGAVVVIYNTYYGVVQSRHHFKLFASPPRLWCTSTSLLIAMTHNLVVVPFELEAQLLSALVGAHCNTAETSESDPDLEELHLVQDDAWAVNGEFMDTSSVDEVPESIKQQLDALKIDSCSQSIMVEKLILQLIEKESISELIWCLKHFSDVSETPLVLVLQFCLDKSDVIEKGGKYIELLNTVLSASFSDVSLLPFLRNLSFPNVLSLLEYLADGLESDNLDVEFKKLLDWTNLLLDAHYQRFLLSGDTHVKELFSRLQQITTEQVVHMNELKELLPLLQLLDKGKLPVKKSTFTNKLYSVELIKLY